MKDKNLDRYKDPLGLTTKRMDFGLWYVEHRKGFRKILIFFLVLISAVTWFITIYSFTMYIAVGIREDEELARKITDNIIFGHDYILDIAPKNLKIGQVTALKNLDKYDFFVKMENPNDNYWTEFSYAFTSGDDETKKIRNFVLPGESKYIILLSQTLKSKKVEFKIDDISWSRVNEHEIPDWKGFRDERLDIQFSDIKFTQSQKTGLSEKINLSTLEFSAKNNSPYNYWEVDLNIVFYIQGKVVGINKYIINEFLSGQEKTIHLSMPGRIGNITKTEIIPEINITKDDIYMKY